MTASSEAIIYVVGGAGCSGATATLIYKRSLDSGASWGPLILVPGSETTTNGGPRAVALGDPPGTTVLLSNSNGMLWRSPDAGLSWSAPIEMFNPSERKLEGGGVMIQLSATHKSHPNRLLAAYDQSIPWNKTDPCGENPYSPSCEFASSYWSDDEGKTWQLSSHTVPKLDESELLELEDGRVAMLSRNQSPLCPGVNLTQCATHQDGPCMCVGLTVSSDAGESWGETTEFLPSLWGANCHGKNPQI
jgi:hypothetical protein